MAFDVTFQIRWNYMLSYLSQQLNMIIKVEERKRKMSWKKRFN